MSTYGMASPNKDSEEFLGPWLILEYVEHLLFDDLVQADLTPEVLMGLAAGLNAIHKKGVVHGDLKPENIRVERRGSVWIPKIGDLGSAVDLSEPIKKRLAGTRGYIAPEVLHDSLNYDARADVFALGIIYLMMLTDYKSEDHTRWRLNTYEHYVIWVVDVAGPLIETAQDKYQPLLHAMLVPNPQWRWTSERVLHFLIGDPERKRKIPPQSAQNSEQDRVRSKRVRTGLSDRACDDRILHAADSTPMVEQTDTQRGAIIEERSAIDTQSEPTVVLVPLDDDEDEAKEEIFHDADTRAADDCSPRVLGDDKSDCDVQAGPPTPSPIQDDPSDAEAADESQCS